jgi:preprotein translocase subunit SecB
MSEQFKILTQFVKDMSCETPDVETYLYVKEYLKNYNLDIDITTKPLKNKLVEVNTSLKFHDKELNEKRSHFEIVYASIVKIDEKINNKKELQKIILCDVQNKIYPNLEKAFLNLLNNSGFPGVKLEKKIDFNKLYNEKFN